MSLPHMPRFWESLNIWPDFIENCLACVFVYGRVSIVHTNTLGEMGPFLGHALGIIVIKYKTFL